MRGNGGNSQGRKNLRGKCRAVYYSHGNRQKNCAGDCTEKHRGGKRKNSGIWSGTGDGTDYRHAAGTVGDHRTDAGTCYSRIPRRRSVPGSGGVLRAGDRIHIYCVEQEEEEQNGKLLWENVFVQQVFDRNGAAIGGDDGTTPAQRVNIYMEKERVADFYAALAQGSLRVVKAEDTDRQEE